MDKMYVGEIVEWESGILAIVLRIVGIFSFIIYFLRQCFFYKYFFCVTIVISNKKHKMLTIIKSTS